MHIDTDWTTPVKEETTAFVTAYIQDGPVPTGVAIPLAQLGAVTLTLLDERTKEVIGLWDHLSVKNTNGGTIVDTTVSGVAKTLLTVEIPPDDNAVLNTQRDNENHIALIEWDWAAGTRKG